MKLLKKTPKAIQDVSKLISGNVAVKVIGMAALVFYARVLSKEDMAIFPVYLMCSDFAGLIFSFGIFPTLIRQLPSLFKEDLPQARSLLCTAGLMVVIGTLGVSVFVFFFSKEIAMQVFKNKEYYGLVQIMTIGFLALTISRLAEQVLWAKGHFGHKSLLGIIEAIVKPTFTIPLFLFIGIRGLVLGLVIAEGIKSIIALFYIRDVLRGRFPGFYSITKLLRQSLPFYLESYLMYFRRQGDNWLVASYLGPAALSVYYIAKSAYGIFSSLLYSVDGVATERFAKCKYNVQDLTGKAQRLFDVLLQTVIPLFFLAISLSPSLIPLVYGGKYIGAINPAILLMIALLIQFLRIPLSRTIFVATSASNRVFMTFIETFFLLVGLILLTPVWGTIGVAVARCIGQISGMVVSVWILRNKLNTSFKFVIGLPSLITAGFPTCLVLFLLPISQKPSSNFYWASITVVSWSTLFLLLTLIGNRSALEQASQKIRAYIIT